MSALRRSFNGQEQHESLSVKAAKDLFRKYDLNKDGTISREALRALLGTVSPNLTDVEFDHLVLAIDKNHDLVIDYDEFIEFIFLDSAEKQGTTRRRYVSMDAVRVLFVVWQELLHERMPGGTVERRRLLEALDCNSDVMKTVRAMPLFTDHADFTEEERTLHRLWSREVRDRVAHLQEEDVTREAFVRAVWPALKEHDREFAVRCMNHLLAQRNIGLIWQHVCQKRSLELQPADVHWTFVQLDGDNSKTLSVKELTKAGKLPLKEAMELSEALDTITRDGGLDITELMTAVTEHVNNEFSQTVRALFASSGC